jgi:hypothetical protein
VRLCAKGCPQWSHADERHCYFHSKVEAGLIELEDTSGGWIRRVHRQVRRAARTVGPADVVTDEQREVASLMRVLGAPEYVIDGALARARA